MGETMLQEGAPDGESFVSQLSELHIERCFATPEGRWDFLRSLSVEEFHQMMIWANAGLRELPEGQEGYADPNCLTALYREGGGGHVRQYSPLGHQRLSLLTSAFTAAQRMDDLEAAGVLLGVATMETRPFEYGNGRTARLCTELLRHGFTGSDDDVRYYTQLLQDGEGSKMLNLSGRRAGLSDRAAHWSAYYALATVNREESLPLAVTPFSRENMGITGLPIGDIRRDIADLAEEPIFNRATLVGFIVRSGRDIDRYLLRRVGVGGHYLNTQQLIESVTDEDSRALWDAYAQVKGEYVQSIIDCIANGDESVHGPASRIVAKFFVSPLPPTPPVLSQRAQVEYPDLHGPFLDPISEAIRRVTDGFRPLDPKD